MKNIIFIALLIYVKAAPPTPKPTLSEYQKVALSDVEQLSKSITSLIDGLNHDVAHAILEERKHSIRGVVDKYLTSIPLTDKSLQSYEKIVSRALTNDADKWFTNTDSELTELENTVYQIMEIIRSFIIVPLFSENCIPEPSPEAKDMMYDLVKDAADTAVQFVIDLETALEVGSIASSSSAK